MIALLIGTFAVAGVGIGWYGHKANLRIEAWGRNANELDLIFQAMSECEHGSEPRTGGRSTIPEPVGASQFAGPHFAIGAAAAE